MAEVGAQTCYINKIHIIYNVVIVITLINVIIQKSFYILFLYSMNLKEISFLIFFYSSSLNLLHAQICISKINWNRWKNIS